MLVVNRPPINSNNDDEYYEVLVNRQIRNDKIYDTSRIYASFSLGSTVVVQWEDGGPWTHGMVVERGDHNHSNRPCIKQIKSGWVVTRNNKHIKATPTTAKQYLRDQLSKNTTNTVDEILKHFEKQTEELWQLIAISKDRKTHLWTVTVTHSKAIYNNIL